MSDSLARYLEIESEDDLMRIVFGVLELIGLPVIADVLGMDADAISDDVRVRFHERIDQRAERVPDVLIEAKRGTDFDAEQLREEHDDLRRFGTGEKRLVLLTGHESSPSQLDEVDLEHVEWLGWRDVAL